MTRKDYRLLAAALANVYPVPPLGIRPDSVATLIRVDQWHQAVGAIGQALARDNPRFNHTIWTAACHAATKED